MNIVCITGRTTADIDLKYTPSGTAVAKFTLAVQRQGKDKDSDFISCTAFGKTAEVLAEYVNKGNRIEVSGRIQTGTYEDKQGNKRKSFDVIVDRFGFLESKAKEKSDFGQAQSVDDFDKLFDDLPM